MDKIEVLRLLDQLYLELIREEDVLRERCKEQDDYTPLYYHCLGEISGVKRARWALEEMRSAIAQTEVTEFCPHCKNEVTLRWNVKDRGYKAYCPVCGERLMLCSTCHDDGYGCNYDSKTDGCRWNPAEE